jgi:hypothetical protein
MASACRTPRIGLRARTSRGRPVTPGTASRTGGCAGDATSDPEARWLRLTMHAHRAMPRSPADSMAVRHGCASTALRPQVRGAVRTRPASRATIRVCATCATRLRTETGTTRTPPRRHLRGIRLPGIRNRPPRSGVGAEVATALRWFMLLHVTDPHSCHCGWTGEF